ncbi:tripartite tricarboxylate transporter substrate binding protein [Paracidovorax avenae]
MQRRQFHLMALSAAALGLVPAAARAADAYPSRPVRLVVGFPPGGSADINARLVGQQLAKELGGTLVIENKGGAGGNLAAMDIKRSPADGYNLFYGTSAVVLAPSLYSKPGFDPYTDFIPVSLTATIPLLLVASPQLPARTVAELVSYSKENPGKLNYASSGAGALLHLGGALFTDAMGIKAEHVAYKGSAPAVADLLAGNVQFMLLPINEAMPHVRVGSIRPLAITSDRRSPLVPDVPTMQEATGRKDMEMGAWQGLMAPRGTPPEVIAKLASALQATLADQDLRRKLAEQGSTVLGGTAKQYADYMKQEGARWSKVVQDTGTRLD